MYQKLNKEYKKHRKFIVALTGALVMIAIRQYGADNVILLDIISLLTAFGVYQVKNAE